MAWRSRKILGLVQLSEGKELPQETSNMANDALPKSENVNRCDNGSPVINKNITINESQSNDTEKPKKTDELHSMPDSPQNDDLKLCTPVETEALVNKSVPDIEIKINLVPDYDSDGFSYEDEVENTKEIGEMKLPLRRNSSSSTSSSSSSCSSSSSSSSSSDSDSSSSKENSKEHTGESSKSMGHLASAIVRTAAELEENIMENTQRSDYTSTTLNTTDSRVRRTCATNSTITISPMYTDVSDLDDDVNDPNFDFLDKFGKASHHREKNLLIPSCSDSSSSDDAARQKKGRKRIKNPAKWKQNRIKRMRNEGRSYVSMSNTRKNVAARCLKTPCNEKCKLKCTDKIDTQGRYEIFDKYWKLGDLDKQRAFIKTCMFDIKPRYKYTNAETPRRPNKGFYLTLNNNRIRVCKTFFKSTLDISNRMIYTITTNANEMGFIEEKRGKHGNNKKLDPELLAEVRKHIESIPRIEGHYVRANSTRDYIEGGKTIKDLYRDFIELQTKNNKEVCNYMAYYNIFTTEFNLSFHKPKKDQCDQCVAYKNLTGNEKEKEEEKYQIHLNEKELSRQEKMNDRRNINDKNILVIYDLEAVLQCPKGDTSAFYYKSKLNCYNLTLTELNNKEGKQAYDNVYCYFWTESDAKRGAIEIGSCVWEYLKGISSSDGKNIIFYSDNCCGQNKNKFIATLYMYAVYHLNINSITHKFLIRGHTQNEADSVHSLIEREVKKNLKSGPIYTPDQYIALIKNAKKTRPPISVHELSFDSFVNLKELQEEWGYNYSTDINGQNVNWNEIKQLKMTKDDPFTFYYKTSYKDEEYKEVNVRNKRKKMKPLEEIMLKQAYSKKQELSANKKKDLKELVTKGLIPSYYANFYNSLF